MSRPPLAPRRLFVTIVILGLGLGSSAGSGGCRRRGPPPGEAPRDPATSPEPALSASERQLLAIAEAIDPGEVTPLLQAAPGWLREALDSALAGEATPAALLARLRAERAVWALGAGDRETKEPGIEGVLRLGRALYLAERLWIASDRPDVEVLVALEEIYGFLTLPALSSEVSWTPQMIEVLAEQAVTAGLLADAIQREELLAFLRETGQRAGPLRRRVAALLLREHPSHPGLPRVLWGLADEARQQEDFAAAVARSELALERTSDPSPTELLGHAKRCYLGFDLAAGDASRDAAIAKAGESTALAAELTSEITRVTRVRGQVAELLALGDPQAEEAIGRGLRRAELFRRLGRYQAATAAYDQLIASHPRDARPYVGLTKIAMARDQKFTGALPLHRARGLENRDREYYEVSLGLRVFSFLEVFQALGQGSGEAEEKARLAGFLKEFVGDLEAWATYEPARAWVALILFEVLRDGLSAILDDGDALRRHATRAQRDLIRLRQIYPAVPELWELSYTAAHFVPQREETWATVSAPLPGALAGNLALQRRRLGTLRALVFLWEHGDLAGDLEAIAAGVPEGLRGAEPLARDLRELDALIAHIRHLAGDSPGGPAAGERALALYTALAAEAIGAERARLLNNVGALRARLGDPEGARAAWREALPLTEGRDHEVIHLNQAVLELGPEVGDRLADLTTAESHGVRLQAWAWYAEFARRRGDAAAAKTRYHQAIDRTRAELLEANLSFGAHGVVMLSSWEMNFGYVMGPEEERFESAIHIDSRPWLVAPAPLTAAKPRRSGGSGN